jgi:ADP-ribosylglycohydrolase
VLPSTVKNIRLRHRLFVSRRQSHPRRISEPLDSVRAAYRFDVSCQGSVPQSIIAFLESSSYEDAVRNAISLGGDADTMACIAGGIAEAFYGGVPAPIQERALSLLDEHLRAVVHAFYAHFRSGRAK